MKRNILMTVAVTGFLVSAACLASAEDLAARTTDQQITQQVKQKLAADEPGVASRIMVTTRDGVVTLMARDLTVGDIETAMRDADNTNGVVRVENRLKMS